MFFRSERLFLRPAWPEDWQTIAQGIGDDAEARAWVGQAYDSRHPACLIVRPQQGEVIGGVSLAPHLDGAELGYWITRRHRGQGYAGEAARAMVTMARVIGHRTLVAHHGLDNPASGRVLTRLGFQPTGALVDQACALRGRSLPAAAYVLTLEGAGMSDDDPDGHSDPAGGMMRRAA